LAHFLVSENLKNVAEKLVEIKWCKSRIVFSLLCFYDWMFTIWTRKFGGCSTDPSERV